MGNMSYCRFENTSRDLSDCEEAIQNGDMSTDMSQYERDGLENLLGHCQEIVAMKHEIEDALRRWDDNEEQMRREEEEEEEEAKRQAEKEDKEQQNLIKKFDSWTKGYDTFTTLPSNHSSYKPKLI